MRRFAVFSTFLPSSLTSLVPVFPPSTFPETRCASLYSFTPRRPLLVLPLPPTSRANALRWSAFYQTSFCNNLGLNIFRPIVLQHDIPLGTVIARKSLAWLFIIILLVSSSSIHHTFPSLLHSLPHWTQISVFFPSLFFHFFRGWEIFFQFSKLVSIPGCHLSSANLHLHSATISLEIFVLFGLYWVVAFSPQ